MNTMRKTVKRKSTLKRRKSHKSGKSVQKQITSLRRTLEPELKRVDNSNGPLQIYVGQQNVNASNYFTTDITPNSASGTGVSQHVGSQIKLVSTELRIQFLGQQNTNTPIKLVLYLIKVKGIPASTGSEVVTKMFEANPFIYSGSLNAGIIDYNSTRSPDYISNYQVVMKKKMVLPMENYASGNIVRDYYFTKKFKNHLIRFQSNTGTYTSGQLILLVFADAGNTGAVGSLTNSVNNTSASGCLMNYSYRHNYTDL